MKIINILSFLDNQNDTFYVKDKNKHLSVCFVVIFVVVNCSRLRSDNIFIFAYFLVFLTNIFKGNVKMNVKFGASY